jgi:hypothetical protein
MFSAWKPPFRSIKPRADLVEPGTFDGGVARRQRLQIPVLHCSFLDEPGKPATT